MYNKGGVSSQTRNILFMSVCFCVLFTADLTIQNMEKTIISSIHDDYEDFEVDGYDLLALLYITFGISLWLGPSAVSLIGLRTSMAIASLIYTIYIGSFAIERSWAIYAATAVGGVGCGLLWTAEGKYLVMNSTPELVSRNIGIFWTFMCSSTLFGNLFTFCKLHGKSTIDKESRRWIVCSLTATAAVATVAFAFLRPAEKSEEQIKKAQPTSPLKELKRTWGVFKTREMLILSITFCFTGSLYLYLRGLNVPGLQQSFNQGVYSPTIGFTLQFGSSAKQMVPLSGILIGVGQLLGGGWQIVQGRKLSMSLWGRKVILITGVVAEILSFFLIFINIPSSAVFANTNDKAIINSNAYIALLCSLLLGIGDGCLNTQNFSIIAVLFPDASAQSCALYKFTKALFVAIGYTISSHLNLHYQLGILTVFGVGGLIAYTIVDKAAVELQKSNEETGTKGGTEVRGIQIK